MIGDLLILALLWLLWCAGHSLLAAAAVKVCLRGLWPFSPACYRLFYNLAALLFLVPVLWWEAHVGGEKVLVWKGFGEGVRLLFWGIALVLAWGGTRAYGLRSFLGLDCLFSGKEEMLQRFRDDGVLAWTRHPWYLAGLLVLWGRDLTVAQLVTASLLSLYLILGAFLEERRLLALFGDAYEEYRRRVPMFIPRRRRSG
ncbi:methyltransferase family protein [Trichloromonas sp.]|uniref:methyltransferase family protein n=1 Tax=Trichloromonas sp. TaxID=3069249 RepID=UPI002A3BABBA|nr:hypothetical protein [Trichloromonas sp.]